MYESSWALLPTGSWSWMEYFTNTGRILKTLSRRSPNTWEMGRPPPQNFPQWFSPTVSCSMRTKNMWLLALCLNTCIFEMSKMTSCNWTVACILFQMLIKHVFLVQHIKKQVFSFLPCMLCISCYHRSGWKTFIVQPHKRIILLSSLSYRKCCKLICHWPCSWDNYSSQRAWSQQQDPVWTHC